MEIERYSEVAGSGSSALNSLIAEYRNWNGESDRIYKILDEEGK